MFILLVGLTACGGTPEQVQLDRRYLTEEQLETQLADIKAGITGEVLDEYLWAEGEEQVFTLLTREHDAADNFVGIFLRHFRVGLQAPELRWTYQDSISCKGAVAGANLVKDRSPELRPAAWLANDQEQFVLRYQLGCRGAESQEDVPVLVVINAQSGTPEVRLEAGLTPETVLAPLPATAAARLRLLWEGDL